MNITIDLKPAVVNALELRASSRGLDSNVLAAELIESALLPFPDDVSKAKANLEAALRDLSQFAEMIQCPPDRIFSRDEIYADHP